jgi:hypothetical protein
VGCETIFYPFQGVVLDYLQMSHDSIIYKTIRNKEDTQKQQEDLTSAAKWEKDWLMSFHPE